MNRNDQPDCCCEDCWVCDDVGCALVAPFTGVFGKLYKRVRANARERGHPLPFSPGLCFVAWVIDALCFPVVIAVYLAGVLVYIALYLPAMVAYYLAVGVTCGARALASGVRSCCGDAASGVGAWFGDAPSGVGAWFGDATSCVGAWFGDAASGVRAWFGDAKSGVRSWFVGTSVEEPRGDAESAAEKPGPYVPPAVVTMPGAPPMALCVAVIV